MSNYQSIHLGQGEKGIPGSLCEGLDTKGKLEDQWIESNRVCVVKLKSRTHRLLPPMSQPRFVVQRDNEWRAVYAGETANVYINSTPVHGWTKNRW